MSDSAKSTYKGILVLDVDGTLDCGNPAGKVTPKHVAEFRKEFQGWKIIAFSRKVWNAKTREKLQKLGLDGLFCEALVDKKTKQIDWISLHPWKIAYRKAFWLAGLCKGYTHSAYVGDRECDQKGAELANVLFVHVDDFMKLFK